MPSRAACTVAFVTGSLRCRWLMTTCTSSTLLALEPPGSGPSGRAVNDQDAATHQLVIAEIVTLSTRTVCSRAQGDDLRDHQLVGSRVLIVDSATRGTRARRFQCE